ncbi:magnesium transporter CorA family protein [Mycobacterium sp. AZCC_0083]|uniref:magnesium transporter CorA family protein n=1 Tax=Mycobacterium sp. AZCC_0083 TaxID=2735882 RepID=UPI0016104AA5|nr:magnesium transporter CorA family protein [Mycobacterium sp. AZCC_0083]MBB5163373.1 magnesium transporter [Mycobacterium sp. AZCC_0083]
MSQVRGRVWRAGKSQDDFEFASISDYLVEKDTLVWADIYDPDHAALTELAQELGLNDWAVEDAVGDAERTKATVYKTHTFFTVYAVAPTNPKDDTESALSLHRISGFVLPQGLITVRLAPRSSPVASLAPGDDIDAISQRFDELGGQEYGVGALVHGLLDVVVDGHFEAVQCLDDAVESIEDDLFADASPKSGLQRRTFRLRKDLVELRRVVLPMREVVSAIQHRRLDAKTAPELDPLYADLYDHVLRASEWTESLRDMVSTVFETNLSLQDARLNTVMKKLTGWAAIIAVPTAITGFYGQNVQYPGIQTVAGFITSTALIVLLVTVLYVSFKRRDWL